VSHCSHRLQRGTVKVVSCICDFVCLCLFAHAWKGKKLELTQGYQVCYQHRLQIYTTAYFSVFMLSAVICMLEMPCHVLLCFTIDKDECKEVGVCSQLCVNVKHSFKCECAAGYTLMPDHHTCRAEGKFTHLCPRQYYCKLQWNKYISVLEKNQR